MLGDIKHRFTSTFLISTDSIVYDDTFEKDIQNNLFAQIDLFRHSTKHSQNRFFFHHLKFIIDSIEMAHALKTPLRYILLSTLKVE